MIIKRSKKSDPTDAFDLNNSALTRVIVTFCIMYAHTSAAISRGLHSI